MGTRLAPGSGPSAMTPHTSGIFADMTVDGPEIGTLVLVVDRAKNLPNRKTMGKQNPYCAARLGKEAKKTETDKRGGQTPRWDQEVRFTVHDSPDYHNLKLSVFSEDKRTDLIGEAWVSLADVVVPGGGKNDLWQGLNCKGKYAGEIRLELTYYDTRPKPEDIVIDEGALSRPESATKVKRRPLPNNLPSGRGLTPDTIPEPPVPGRAKHGPRDYSTPLRAKSLPPEVIEQAMKQVYGQGYAPASSTYGQPVQPPQHLPTGEDPFSPPEVGEPDFLPQLPPSSRQRTAMQQRQELRTESHYAALPRQPPQPPSLPHSHSAPVFVPVHPHYEHGDFLHGQHLHTQAPEPIPDLDFQHQQMARRRSDVMPDWEHHYRQPYVEDEEAPAPPPPPTHSYSAPVVPQHHSPGAPGRPRSSGAYGSTSPQDGRGRHYIPDASPLQSIERQYERAQQTPPDKHPRRGQSLDGYASEENGYDLNGIIPPSLMPQHGSPYSVAHHTSSRHSIASSYHATPPRPHPLSQEIPRSRSPLPYNDQYQTPPSASYHQGAHGRGSAPIVKPRALSPQPSPKSNSIYSIQHPIRAFESSDESPLSTTERPTSLRVTARVVDRQQAPRKSVSPAPSPAASQTSTPFSPDCFDTFNPASRNGGMAASTSPHAPYAARPDAERDATAARNGPIVGWHGQEIDPSDHLPVDCWAPEPIPKTPSKTYGLGRDRDFGPRSKEAAPGSGGRQLSRDTVVNIRSRNAAAAAPVSSPQSGDGGIPGRNRLQKKPPDSLAFEPLRERHDLGNAVPNPYEQQAYSPGGGYTRSPRESYDDAPIPLHSDRGYGLPAIPPKLPLSHTNSPVYYNSEDALSREISNIDIGSRRNSRQDVAPLSAPPSSGSPYGGVNQIHFVPVRSHRDRHTHYLG